MDKDEAIKELLAALKERHEVVMDLLGGDSYSSTSISGKVTLLLRKHGIEPEVSQQFITT